MKSECRLAASLVGPGACNMKPNCPYCGGGEDRSVEWPLMDWCRGLIAMSESYGPVHYSVCGGEPSMHRNLMMTARVISDRDYVGLSSNIIGHDENFGLIANQARVSVAASFHPYYWGTSIAGAQSFATRILRLVDLGVKVTMYSVVGHPPLLSQIPSLLDAARSRLPEMAHHVLPFSGRYRDLEYPASYTADEWSLILRLNGTPEIGVASEESGDHKNYWMPESTRGHRCYVGSKYVCIWEDGEVTACYKKRHPTIGNILRQQIRLFDEPIVCDESSCPCGHMWEFIVDEPSRSDVASSEHPLDVDGDSLSSSGS